MRQSQGQEGGAGTARLGVGRWRGWHPRASRGVGGTAGLSLRWGEGQQLWSEGTELHEGAWGVPGRCPGADGHLSEGSGKRPG